MPETPHGSPKPPPSPHKNGRPSAITPDVQEKVANYLRAGISKEDAARLSGIAPSTLFKHQAEDPEFSEALAKAVSEFKARMVAAIQKAGQQPKHWQANAWIMERRFPDEYGRRVVEVQGPGGGPVPVTFQRLRELAQNGHGKAKKGPKA